MTRVLDRLGQRFGRLLVIEFAGVRPPRGAFWLCRCDCGKEKVICANSLHAGYALSCGCLMRERVAENLRKARFKHGLSTTPEYTSYDAMRQRCLNKNHKNYHYYGGRGITICERWLEDFRNFLEDLGPKPSPKHSLERIDRDGNYEPGNCRWATQKEQTRNFSRNRPITIGGVTKLLVEWSEETGIHLSTLRARLRLGKTPEEAVAEGVDGKFRNGLAKNEMARLRAKVAELEVENSSLRSRLAQLESHANHNI